MEIDIQSQVVMPLFGGALIGLSVTLMLILNGRVTGISGIANGLLTYVKGDMLWRGLFILGLVMGGVIHFATQPELFLNSSGRSLWFVGIGGLLVGFGTVMGGGCTSGHGVCGISRFSPRSLIATVVFILFGFLTVTLLRLFLDSGVQ